MKKENNNFTNDGKRLFKNNGKDAKLLDGVTEQYMLQVFRTVMWSKIIVITLYGTNIFTRGGQKYSK